MRSPVTSRRLAVEELERRDNPFIVIPPGNPGGPSIRSPVPAVVLGTPNHDIITLQNLTGTTVQVTVASFSDPAYTTPVGTPTTTTVDGTAGISVLAGDGDDTVKIVGDTPLNANTQIDGGAGNDRVAVFAPLAQPVTFTGGDGTDTVDLFATIQIITIGTTYGFPAGDTLFATDAAVARQGENAVFFTGTESTVVHGTVYPDILVASAGLPAPVTFVQGGGDVIDTVYLAGTAGDDVFYASDAAIDRVGDAAVFLPADSTSTVNVTVFGDDGNDAFFMAADTAVKPRPNTFAPDYSFDGGPGFNAVYLNGSAGADQFGLNLVGAALAIRRDPTAAAVYVSNTAQVNLYGFGGDDTLNVRADYFGNNLYPVTVGFEGGDGTDTVLVQTPSADDPAVAARYQFGPDRVDGPNGRTVFYDSVEATGVVNPSSTV